MGALKRIFSSWWVLTLGAAVLAALVLALGLPIFVSFLRPWWARLLLVLIVFTVWGGFAAWRVMKARKASDAIAKELAKPTPGEAETEQLQRRMAEALGRLRKASGDKRDYLYSRPWYVIIGPPGAGKTTALLNSGLRFPFSDASLKGVGGTRNLDFWFADEAALVDTAGRYTTQDSDAATDATAWHGFLKLLRKHRPLQPINGVLVAIGLDELMAGDRASIDAHAAAVRRRLRELRATLEVAAPVYVLFTKADLLAGFVEFYDDLDVEGRRAVLGATLPWGDNADAARLSAAFDGLTQSAADRTSVRLQEEADARRRGLILGFPSQVEALRSRALRFLEGAFLAEGAAGLPLRGFYLTSGVQQGAPLDRILSGLAEVYDQAPARAAAGGGRAYFLNRLLSEVVFAEAGLVQSDPKAAARRRAAFIGAGAAIAAVALLTLVLWAVSFTANRRLQGELLAGAQNIQSEVRATSLDLVEVRETDPDLEQSLSILNRLRELPRGYEARKAGGAPLFSTFGLHQRSHSKSAEQAYLEGLQRILLPRILLRLERVLQENSADPLALYEPLKVYLMLGGHGPLDRKAVRAWVREDWETAALPGADRAATRKALEGHLDALLEDPQLGRVWPERRAPLDGGLVESARASVATLSLADRAYVILRQKAAAAGAPWTLSTVLSGGDARAFANGDGVLQLSVPYFFTREGYEKAYLLGLQTVPQELEKELWVLGPEAETTAIKSQLAGVRSGVAALYAQEYTKAWEGVVASLQPADYFRDPAAFGAFTRNPSPLKLVLLEVRKNTTFTGGALNAAAKKAAANPLGKLVAGAAASGQIDAGRQIQDYFRPLHDYVGDGKAPGALDEFVAAVKQAGSANAAAGVAGGGAGGAAAQGQLAMATGAVAAAAAGAPPMLQGFIASASEGGRSAAVSSAQGAIADTYAREILAACRAVTQDRYPFFGAAQNEVAVADALRVFGLNGRLDAFQSGALAALIDTSGPVWRWRADEPIAAALDPSSAEQFQKAAEIRDLLAGGLPYQVEATGFGGAVTAVEFAAGGVVHRFEAGTMGARPAMWSLTGGAPEAHVTLIAGDKEVRRFQAEGVWALFRLMDEARKENAGPTAFKATFGEGAASATLKITLRTARNPFSRGGAWSFRCPAAL